MEELTLAKLAKASRVEAEEAIRGRVQTVYIGDHRVLSRVLGRLKLYLSTEDQGFAGHVMLDGYWEIWLTLFLARYVRPGMTVIDVGANFGYYTILLADAVGPSGHVISVEPVPETAELLERSVALNGFAERTRIVRKALGRAPDGEVFLWVPPREPKNAAVVQSTYPGAKRVPTTNLDTLAGSLPRLDLIKIDAEGSEVEILAGTREVITRHRPAVLLEFNAARYADPKGFLDFLKPHYPTLRALTFDGDLIPVTAQDVLTERFGEDWLLFLKAT